MASLSIIQAIDAACIALTIMSSMKISKRVIKI